MKAYGSGCIGPHFLDLFTSWRWVVKITPRPLYPWERATRYPLDKRLGEPRSRSVRFGEEKILYPTGTRTSTPRLPVNTLNNLVGCGLCISICWILHQAAFTITYNTSNYITWTSNFFWFFIWPKLAQTTPEDLPWQTARDEFIFQTAAIIDALLIL
jgi:hypothetical protein